MAANQNCQPRVITATLSANTVDLAVLTEPGFGVQVSNDNALAPIYFTVGRPGGANPVPTVNGVSCWCASSVAAQSVVTVRHPAQFGSVVQLISAGTPQYTVTVVGNQASS